ncbi:VOC family protein [Paraburkholderia sp.]|jgi:PhnB protein|uniref:VOC family protein n=1 Tax=Paraburkholderia sp. TaxID=1926495 RepID=UPI002F4103EA
MHIQPYVFFDGQCEEALRFYGEKLGAQVLFQMRYKDAPPDTGREADPKTDDMIMHASVKFGEAIVMMSDDCMSESVTHTGFNLSLHADNAADAEKYFNALAEGGQIRLPFQATFWSKGFGMLTDRFGIGWMVSVPEEH